ncbi:hypothetical protein [Streptomyces sp. NPDC001222]|uniref:hypothetical protein n=1 Tax=Streptomyces sp. NPDC001222 TaxID=3364548 RepID=UPI003678C88C
MKLGVATVAAAVALLGGATTASARSYDDVDPDWASLCEDDESTQVTCQFGEDDESLIIYQTNIITVGHDFNGDLDVTLDREPA